MQDPIAVSSHGPLRQYRAVIHLHSNLSHDSTGTEEEDLRLLWRREMVLGAYRPRWLEVRTEDGPVRAIAFVVDRKHPGYSGRLTDDRIVSVALRAHGHYGACADYLVETADALAAHGIADRHLDRLARQVRAARLQGDSA